MNKIKKTSKTEQDYQNCNFNKSCIYEIRVLGELPEEWSDRLGGMQIIVERKTGSKTVTILTGRISDQAALSGILNTLYDRHMTVISVKMYPEKLNI